MLVLLLGCGRSPVSPTPSSPVQPDRRWVGESEELRSLAGAGVAVGALDGATTLVATSPGTSSDYDGFDGAAYALDPLSPSGPLADVTRRLPSARTVALPGDLTGDGAEDVVLDGAVYGSDGGREAWFPDGDLAMWDFAFADFDHDGAVDLAAVGSDPSADLAVARVAFGPLTGEIPDGAGITLHGPSNDWSHGSVAAGDVTGDGVPDLVLGAESHDRLGGVWLVPDPEPGDHDLTDVGVVWTSTERDWAGENVLVTGDLDGDGDGDVVAAGKGVDGFWDGVVYLIPDLDGGSLADARSTVSGRPDSGLGWALAAADLDGDGQDDLVIGAPGNLVGYDGVPGRVVAFRGPVPAGPLDPSADADWQVAFGADADDQDQLGHDLAVADVDGDGLDDLVIGAPGYQNATGAVYLVRGSSL